MTSLGELDTFEALVISDGGLYAADRQDLIDAADAVVGVGWDQILTPGEWESDTARCEPVGLTTGGQILGQAAADIFALALAGYLEQDDTYYASAKTHLLELAATTGFGNDGVFSGADQCALDLGTAVAVALEAARILEADYVNWSPEDRLTLATWAVEEATPLVSWPVVARKNNWGFVALGSMISIAAFAEGGIDLLPAFSGDISPEDYLDGADELLLAQLSTSDPLTAAAADCSTAAQVYGLQSYGAFPDELRRYNGTSDTTRCDDNPLSQTTEAYDPGCIAAGDCDTGTAHFYQQKATNNFARVAEALRRIDGGSGARGFDIAPHGGANEALYDAASFSTSGFTTFVQDTTMGFCHVAASYYDVQALADLCNSGTEPVRGGLDFPYTRILFAPNVVAYNWNLGDLADQASRFNVEWDTGEWADAYDTEAELNALGWATVNITNNPCTDLFNADNNGSPTSQETGSPDGRCDSDNTTFDFTCAHGGVGSDEDELAWRALLAFHCSAPTGGAAGSCSNVFKLAASCTLDAMADYGNDSGSQPAFYNYYSNIAILGADPETSVFSANNIVDDNQDLVDDIFGTGLNGGGGGGSDGSTYTWNAGDTSAMGQSVIWVSTACSSFTDTSLVQIIGSDEDGETLVYTSRVTARAAHGGDCDLTIADPLPTAFSSKTSVQIKGQNGPKNTVLLNFTAEFPYLPEGTCTSTEPSTNNNLHCGKGIHGSNYQQLLVQGVRMGPIGSDFIGTENSYRVVLRGNDIGPSLHSLRRANNGGIIARNYNGSLMSIYDNVFREGAIRLQYSDGSAQFGYLGFNYQVDQVPTHPSESGEYCNNVSNPQGFPNVSGGPERSLFIYHDTPVGTGRVGRVLMEANDFKCRFFKENGEPTRRYFTLFRNRFIGQQAIAVFQNGNMVYPTIIANRVGTWTFNTANIMDNLVGKWNIGQSSIQTPTGDGTVTWPTVGTGRNYVRGASLAHSDYGSVSLPPSLAFRTDTAPDWWCQESGPWDGTWSFGYGDGGDNGGTPRKLPAQIRYEIAQGEPGVTCTPP